MWSKILVQRGMSWFVFFLGRKAMNTRVTRRDFLKVASGGLALTVLSACAVALPATEGGEAQTSEPVTIQLMYWPVGGERGIEAMGKALVPFQEANPEITVEQLATPWDNVHEKFLTTSAGGVPPDVSAVDNYFLTQFASKGILLSLDDRVNADPTVDGEDYFEAAWNEGVWEGQRWSMPYIGSTRVMYFNIDLFEAAGVPRPDEQWEAGEWTWEAFLESTAALTDTSGEVMDTIYGAQADTSMWGGLQPWIWGAGGDELNEDRTQSLMNTPEAVAGLEYCQDLIHVHGVAPTRATTQDVNLVGTGRIGVWASWRGLVMGYRSFDYSWEVVPFPVGSEGKGTLYKGNSMVTAKAGKNLDQAWELCKYMSSQEADAIWITNGGATPRKDNIDVLLASTPPQNNAYFYQPLAEGWARTLPFTPLWVEWTRSLRPYLDRVFLDGEDVQTVMDEAVVTVDAILQGES
jgi:ABC-type glycerol-3-phosphate transport system substrate-binding protein